MICFFLTVGSVPEEPPELLRICKRVDFLRTSGQYAPAARRAERLVETFPGEGRAWFALALCHLETAWELRNDARAEEAIERTVGLTGENATLALLSAQAKFRQGKYKAFEELSERLHTRYWDALASDQRADLLTWDADGRLRNHPGDAVEEQKALAELAQALQLHPDHAHALLLRASYLIERGRHAEALQDLQRALPGDPGNKQIHYQLRSCYARLKQSEAARHHYQIWKHLNRLTDSVVTRGGPGPEERLQILRELAVQNPADLPRRLELVQLEWLQGDRAAAEREFTALRAEAGDWPPLEGFLEGLQSLSEEDEDGP